MKIGLYILDTGYWMLKKEIARAAQALALLVALLLFIKSTEYLVIQYQVSSIQHLGQLLDSVFVQRIWPNC
jgi:hypothetical protein